MNFMELQPKEAPAWMSNFPEVKPRDIIVEANDGNRWRIVRVQPTRKRRSVVHQNLVVTEIGRDHVEWKIDIPGLNAQPVWDTQGQFLTARHNLEEDTPW